MGSIFGTKQPAPPPPAPPATLRDEVNGVEQVPVVNTDGTTTYVTRKIPLTAEQQAQQDELNRIMQESLGEIQKLSASTYAPDEATQQVLKQWDEVHSKLLEQQAQARTASEEQALARRGLGDSSAAVEVRRQRALDAQDAQKTLQLQKDEMANQVRADKLALQQNLYNIAASATDAQNAKVYQAAMRGQGDVAAINAQRQATLLDYYNAQYGRGGSTFGSALGTGLGGSIGRSVGGVVLGALGGLGGSVAGGLLGSIFRR